MAQSPHKKNTLKNTILGKKDLYRRPNHFYRWVLAPAKSSFSKNMTVELAIGAFFFFIYSASFGFLKWLLSPLKTKEGGAIQARLMGD